MCEFNRPFFIPHGHHPDDYPMRNEITVLPPSAWQKRAAELAEDEQTVINNAVQEAAALAADVHLYRSVGSRFLGLSIEPGSGPNVKIWEH